MLFSPQTYRYRSSAKGAAILNAHSDTTVDGRDVFGYLPDGEVIFAKYTVDEDGDTWAEADLEW